MSAEVYFGILAVDTLLGIIILMLWMIGNHKFRDLMASLPDDGHPLKVLYPLGFEVLELLHYNYSGRIDRKYINYCKIFYGEKNGHFYYCINLTQKISVPAFIALAGMALGLLMDSLLVTGMSIGAAAGIAYYYHTLITDIIKEREESITSELPDVLSKMTLLVNAGMVMREAWKKTSAAGEGVLYEEMRNAVMSIDNGASEMDAYAEFARRCAVPAVTKFTGTLLQNLSKGNREMVEFLKMYSQDSWNERKQEAKRKGEAASTKLVIPVTLMFMGIMIMIAVPILTGISI